MAAERERSKTELIDDANALGIDTEGKTKAELQDAVAERNPPELGPVVPEGSEPQVPKPDGKPTVGVQPSTPEEVPEAGR